MTGKAVALLAALALATGCGGRDAGSARAGPSALESYRRARAVVERALDVMGSPARVEAAGGLRVRATGVRSAGAELQGIHPDSASPGAFREAFALDPSRGRVGVEHRFDRYDGTREWLREVYRNEDEHLILVLQAEPPFPVLLRSPGTRAARRKLLRRIPVFLLEELLAAPASLRWSAGGAGLEAVTGTLGTGETLSLSFRSDDGTLARVEYVTDVQGYGDASVGWAFGDYRPVEGLGLFPYRWTSSIQGRVRTEMTVDRVEPGIGASSFFRFPDGMEAPEEPIEVPEESDASRGARVDTLASGVYRVRNLRTGFHPIFVELDSFVVAMDAPAGYRLTNELPAGDVAPGPSSAWLSERFLELMAETVPDKPVGYVVLTHFHGDHAGGLRAFVEEGATILVAPPAEAAVRRFVEEAHTLAPDDLSRNPTPLKLEVVEGRRILGEGQETAVEVLDVGPNPHTLGMLVARVPGRSLGFVSDLLDPTPSPEGFPKPYHAPLDRWFARWAAGAGWEPRVIYTMHGAGRATSEHLERAR